MGSPVTADADIVDRCRDSSKGPWTRTEHEPREWTAFADSYTAWNRDNADISNIKYFWVQGVGNSNTKAVIARALKAAGKELEKWPGTTLDMEGDGALAILGRLAPLVARVTEILICVY